MVFIHKLCLSPTLSSLSQVFSLWKYMEIKTDILIYPPWTLFCLTFFFYILSNRPWKSFNIIDRELSCSLFPSLTPSFFLTAHSIVWLPRSYLVRNLGCFLTFVFTTSATVNYLVHMSFLCHRYNFRVNSQ